MQRLHPGYPFLTIQGRRVSTLRSPEAERRSARSQQAFIIPTLHTPPTTTSILTDPYGTGSPARETLARHGILSGRKGPAPHRPCRTPGSPPVSALTGGRTPST